MTDSRSTPSIPVAPQERRIRGHWLIYDGPTIGGADRWTCECGAAVLKAGGPDYGSALEADCFYFNRADLWPRKARRGDRPMTGEARPTPVEPEARPHEDYIDGHALVNQAASISSYDPTRGRDVISIESLRAIFAELKNESRRLAVEPDGLPLDVERLRIAFESRFDDQWPEWMDAAWNEAVNEAASTPSEAKP